MRIIPVLTLGALVMGVVVFIDAARPLGAHPWWSQKSLLIGTPIGLILAALAIRTSRPLSGLFGFVLATAVALTFAKYGQTQFAASYAEDALAGRMWYFGWIATGASLAGGITTGIAVMLSPRKS
ncbi:hypothetical protein [uncultured Shimia sp.]|uniref:hypothetical protein n=1 Tax=uncultured Shimia sp. TaxID=573152 RepID=UPI002628E450|nr:hypothetical protein [uncultured Shimia sp.]